MIDIWKHAGKSLMKPRDFDGKPIAREIRDLTEELFEGDEEATALLHFTDDHRRLTLNPTRTRQLIALLGSDVDRWPGQRIAIRKVPCPYGKAEWMLVIEAVK